MKLLHPCLLSFTMLLGINSLLFSQDLITGSGGDISGAGGSISFSLGQLGYNSLEGGGFSMIEGVQQPKEISVLVSIWLEEEGIEIYPNPAKEYIKFIYPKIEQERSIRLFSMKGKLLKTISITEAENLIDVRDLSPGLYFLLIQKGSDILHAHQIIIE